MPTASSDHERNIVTVSLNHEKEGKADFSDVYNQADPRRYFCTLGELEYQAPAHGARVFSRLVEMRRQQLDREDLVVLDLCSSYGINAALLNHDLQLDTLYARYRSAELASLSSSELALRDREFYRQHRRARPVTVVGADIADNAVAYAKRVGLHQVSTSENLETDDPSESLIAILEQVDLITVTGGIGYITERTFDRLLKHAGGGRGCWVATFVLRWVDYGRIADTLSTYGMETAKLADHTFGQRRFVDDAERAYVIKELEKMNIDPAGKEEDGWYHSHLYLSRPAHQDDVPWEQLLPGCIS